jgi:hypothetical protein
MITKLLLNTYLLQLPQAMEDLPQLPQAMEVPGQAAHCYFPRLSVGISLLT